jgi:hypothetical protein
MSKEKYIQLTEEELEALEAEANRSIDLKEFCPRRRGNKINNQGIIARRFVYESKRGLAGLRVSYICRD